MLQSHRIIFATLILVGLVVGALTVKAQNEKSEEAEPKPKEVSLGQSVALAIKEGERLRLDFSKFYFNFDERNTRWKKYLDSVPGFLDADTDLKRELNASVFLAVYLVPIPEKDPRAGGDLFIFVDREKQRIIKVLRFK